LYKGEPQICDLGISLVMEETDGNTVPKTVSSADMVRYAAPEVIENGDVFVTAQSDTYSFAMLILECITELPPFSYIARDAAVIHTRITKKQSPLRPEGEEGIWDELWDLMNRCWIVKPEQRPTMDQVHIFFFDRRT
jgi:hypothetical protein